MATKPWWQTGIEIVGSLAANNATSNAATAVSNASQNATNTSIAETIRQNNINNANQQPFIGSGVNALNALNTRLGLPNQSFTPFSQQVNSLPSASVASNDPSIVSTVPFGGGGNGNGGQGNVGPDGIPNGPNSGVIGPDNPFGQTLIGPSFDDGTLDNVMGLLGTPAGIPGAIAAGVAGFNSGVSSNNAPGAPGSVGANNPSDGVGNPGDNATGAGGFGGGGASGNSGGTGGGNANGGGSAPGGPDGGRRPAPDPNNPGFGVQNSGTGSGVVNNLAAQSNNQFNPNNSNVGPVGGPGVYDPFAGGDRFNFNLEGDAGYNFAQAEAAKAANRGQASVGGFNSGNRLAELSDRATGIASQFANDAFNRQIGSSRENFGRDLTEFGLGVSRNQDIYGRDQNFLNRLAALSGTGQTAVNNVGITGANSASNIGNYLNNNAVNQGNSAIINASGNNALFGNLLTSANTRR